VVAVVDGVVEERSDSAEAEDITEIPWWDSKTTKIKGTTEPRLAVRVDVSYRTKVKTSSVRIPQDWVRTSTRRSARICPWHPVLRTTA
jgi:hypothetical protein